MVQEEKVANKSKFRKNVLGGGNKMGRYYKKLFQENVSSTLEYEFTRKSQ